MFNNNICRIKTEREYVAQGMKRASQKERRGVLE